MDSPQILTAEQFAERKHELPDGGRWVELIAGEVTTLDPPDTAHGDAILNFSKAIAGYARQPGASPGYACFELGLVTARRPDTVRCPAVSWFAGSDFAESDKIITDAPPLLVVEIASTRKRRMQLATRVREYLDRGTAAVWALDPVEQQVHICRRDQPAELLGRDQPLLDDSTLPGFSVAVAGLFAEPTWWRG
jgi:Uma2 family endonuclease